MEHILKKSAHPIGVEGPVLTIVMDGVGIGNGKEGDAVANAYTPTLDMLMAKYPTRKLAAHGTAVGLPSDDDMGNSEVGHNALGSGQVFSQGAKLVSESIASGKMFEGETWKELVAGCKDNGTFHFIGLFSVVNRWAYYTVRIPCDHFESFLHETEGFGNVTSTSRDAQNVTSAYTDYEARLSSLNTQEERLLDMLAKSEDVETLIALEQRLSDVRYEIESIERNLRNYDMQIKYSTVNLDLREVEVYTPTVPVRRTFSQKLADSLSDGWNGFTRGIQNVILGLASALPALILLAVITAAVIVCIKKARKKRKAKKAAQDPTPPQDPQ